MERDQYRQAPEDLYRDTETKEASTSNFESGAPDSVTGHADETPRESGTMGDSRPDETSPENAEFVSAEDDPNLRITRRTSELTEPQRDLAEEMDNIRHDDTKIVAKPMGPIDDEGAEIRPLSSDAKEAAEGDDS